jgi:hypothetical protein
MSSIARLMSQPIISWSSHCGHGEHPNPLLECQGVENHAHKIVAGHFQPRQAGIVRGMTPKGKINLQAVRPSLNTVPEPWCGIHTEKSA